MCNRVHCWVLAAILLGCGKEPGLVPPGEQDPISASTPEAQGVESDRLRELLREIVRQDLRVHSLMILRHDHIVLDAVLFPYDGTRPHDFASCTKSLTATALGLALREGEIQSLDRTLLSFFPERRIDNDGAEKRAITLAHALSMTSGFDCVAQPTETTLMEMQTANDWVGYALDVPMADAPGQTWRYCSTVFQILSAVISASTARPLDEFLQQELFEPIGAEPPAWPRDPQGVSHGWGDARLRPGAMARVGQVFLHRGTFAGVRLLGSEFIEAATTNRVGTLGPSDGYGYGWWTTNEAVFYANGRGGQFVFVAPEHDVVVVATGGATPEQVQTLVQLLSNELAEGFAEVPLASDPDAVERLDAQVAAVARPPAAEPIPIPPSTAAEVSGRRYELAPNLTGWDAISLSFHDAEASLTISLGATRTDARIGLDEVARVTRGVRFAGLERYRDIDIALKGRWIDEKTLEVHFDTIDTIDAGSLRFTFVGDTVTVALGEKTGLGIDLTLEGTATSDAS